MKLTGIYCICLKSTFESTDTLSPNQYILFVTVLWVVESFQSLDCISQTNSFVKMTIVFMIYFEMTLRLPSLSRKSVMNNYMGSGPKTEHFFQ